MNTADSARTRQAGPGKVLPGGRRKKVLLQQLVKRLHLVSQGVGIHGRNKSGCIDAAVEDILECGGHGSNIDSGTNLSGLDSIIQHLFPKITLTLQDCHISVGQIRIILPALENDGDIGVDNVGIEGQFQRLAISCSGAVDAIDVCVNERQQAHAFLVGNFLMNVLPLDDPALDDLPEEVHLVAGIVEDGAFAQAGGTLDVGQGDFPNGGLEHQLESCVEKPFFVAFSHDDAFTSAKLMI